jgi:hypothetical protein
METAYCGIIASDTVDVEGSNTESVELVAFTATRLNFRGKYPLAEFPGSQ